jgi:hypothetical protein
VKIVARRETTGIETFSLTGATNATYATPSNRKTKPAARRRDELLDARDFPSFGELHPP